MTSQPTIEDVYPLTAIQQGLLFEGMAYEGERYVQQICVRFTDIADSQRLRTALTQLIAQEPILRTMFDWEGDEPIQIVLGNTQPVITFHDCKSVELELPKILDSEMHALAKPNLQPPVRFAILQETGKQPALLATYHHVLMDGPGVDILLHKLHHIYQVGGSEAVPNATKSYVGWTMANVGNVEQQFWQKHLRDLHKTDGQLLAYAGGATEEVSRASKRLSPTLSRALHNMSHELHATPAVLMQAMWTLWAGTYFHKKAFHYGLVQSTRVPGVVDDTALGVFINTLPWLAATTSATLRQMTEQIQSEMLAMDKAKHYSLSAINQQVSPYASRFDSILTITTGNTASDYAVLATRENTGYTLALDVSLSTTAIEITCAVPSDLGSFGLTAHTIIESFAEAVAAYLSQPSQLVELTQTYESVDVDVQESASLTDDQRAAVATALQTVLAQPISTSDLGKSFIELGGDSVDALKVSTLLAKAGMRFPVGNLLDADSVEQAASGQRAITTAQPSAQSGTVISLGQRAGLAYWQAGAARDYHEQTAFALDGTVDQKHFKQAVIQLTKSLPSLRIVYRLEKSVSPVALVRPTMPTDVNFADTRLSFDDWVKRTADSDLVRPFDIEKGPLLRVMVAQAKTKWYLFMSFPSFVCDGWSFSLLLERLFVSYGHGIRKEPQLPQVQQLPLQPIIQDIPVSGTLAAGVEQIAHQDVEVISLDIPAATVRNHLNFAKRHRITASALYMAAYNKAIADGEKIIGVYDANRTFDDGITADAISMYGVVLPCHMTSAGSIVASAKQAQVSLSKSKKRIIEGHDSQGLSLPPKYYFVYENYPRETEEKLRGGIIPYFKECGEWRRQTLPPGAHEGLVVEPTLDGGLKILLLHRHDKHITQEAKKRISLLQTVLNKLEDKD